VVMDRDAELEDEDVCSGSRALSSWDSDVKRYACSFSFLRTGYIDHSRIMMMKTEHDNSRKFLQPADCLKLGQTSCRQI
jgi:hypothetical protein